ncbi:hypothetical protein, partial [Chromobacterium alticapitis]|uniref:hypothetical protein n=1 Tax=Chromobacterium alticapitis TaxID=2073169 RepID=UPI001E3A7B78
VFQRQKKQFQQGFIAREGAAIFGQLAQAHVHPATRSTRANCTTSLPWLRSAMPCAFGASPASMNAASSALSKAGWLPFTGSRSSGIAVAFLTASGVMEALRIMQFN